MSFSSHAAFDGTWSACAQDNALTPNSGCSVYSYTDTPGVNWNSTKSNGDPVVYGMHGVNVWDFIENDDLGSGSSGFFQHDGDAQAGTWSINASLWNLFDDIALVFKDGNGTSLVSYLLADNSVSGSYTSPFTTVMFPNAPGRNTKDISNMSLWGTEKTVTVDEPTTLLLMSLGMIVFGYSHRKSLG